MKALGLEVSDKKMFETLLFDPVTQPIKTIWTSSVGDHQRHNPVKFGQNTMSSFREDV